MSKDLTDPTAKKTKSRQKKGANGKASVHATHQTSTALIEFPGDNKPVTGQQALLSLGITGKATAMRSANEMLPLNDYGLPEYIYRADLVPNDLDTYNDTERGDYLEAAIMELDYSQGFPMLPHGEPFWGQLPSEPIECHRAFMMYLDLPRQKDDNLANSPVRQIHTLAPHTGKATSELLSYAYIYYWQQRALAYDLFITASHNKKKEYLLQDMENEHLKIANKYIEYADQYLTSVFAKPDDHGLTAAETINLLIKMIQVQRLSVGASPFGQKSGKSENELPSNAPLEVILRSITQHNGVAPNSKMPVDAMKLLENDPEAMKQAQELIIRMNTKRNPRQGRGVAPGIGGHDPNRPGQ